MIKDPTMAKLVSDLLLHINGELEESVSNVKSGCSPDEFTAYRRHVGRLINSIFEDILEPIYAMHPGFKPPDLEM